MKNKYVCIFLALVLTVSSFLVAIPSVQAAYVSGSKDTLPTSGEIYYIDDVPNYYMVVSNTHPGVQSMTVDVTDIDPHGVPHLLDNDVTIAAGASEDYYYSGYTVAAGDLITIGGGPLIGRLGVLNTLHVEGWQGSEYVYLDVQKINLVLQPDTEVLISADPMTVLPGGSVTLTITEENTGINTPLSSPKVHLDPLHLDYNKASSEYVGGDINANNKLDSGETWEWHVTVNPTTTTTYEVYGHGTDEKGNDISYANGYLDEYDSVQVTVVVPCIDIIKYVSDDGVTWYDANSPTGPVIPVGDPVYFKVKVTNCGDATLTGISVSDNVYGSVFNAGLSTSLAPAAWDESNVYTLPGGAVVGQHTNIATVTCNEGVTDNDPANYFGEEQGGCTYTPGYWKNHAGYGSPPYDDTWDYIPPDGPDSLFCGNVYGLTWYSVMGFSAKDARALGLKWTEVQKYQHLAFHFVAGILNWAMNGFNVPSDVSSPLEWAWLLLETYPNMKIPSSEWAYVTQLTSEIAYFNEGNIPNWPHCGD